MAKKEKIKSLFDNIAPDYDKLNHILSLNIDKGWRRKAVREIVDGGHAPLAVLDVACGTGDFTIEIARLRHRKNGGFLRGIYNLSAAEKRRNALTYAIKVEFAFAKKFDCRIGGK